MARNLTNIKRLIDNAKKSLEPEQEFVTDLKRSIEMTCAKSFRRPSKYYKPSSMNCMRAMYYMRLGRKPDDDGESYMMWGICNSGTDTHERVQRAISEMSENGFDVEFVDVAKFVKQRELKNISIVRQSGMETHLRHKTLAMSFLCDGIIRYHNHYYIIELKTESSGKWYKRDGVATEHKKQATAYATALGIDDVMFIYINRDVFDFKPYLFHVDGDMKHDFIGMIENCEECVKNLSVPPKPEESLHDRKFCEYCNYKTQCRKED